MTQKIIKNLTPLPGLGKECLSVDMLPLLKAPGKGNMEELMIQILQLGKISLTERGELRLSKVKFPLRITVVCLLLI